MVLAALCLAASPPAVAQKAKKAKKAKKAEKAEPDPAEMEDPKKQASAYYKLGRAKHDEGDYAAALEYFMKAYNALPNPAVYIPIADSYEKLGNIQEAVNYLEKYIAEKPDAGNIVTMKEKLEKLKATPGTVVIESEPPGASITINGEATELVTPAEVELPAGDHALAMNIDGYIMETRAFTVPLGGEVTVEVKLTPTEIMVKEPLPLPQQPVEIDLDEEPEKKKPKVSPAVWAMTGVAGAGLVSATVFGLLALSEQASFDDNPTESKQDKGKAYAIVCDVSWGVAAAAAVTGTILYFVGNKKVKKESAAADDRPIESATVVPVVTEDGGGAAVNMTF
jgi:tetratricopeptide (TPR) repeat protein